jgi:hypothetical protein
MALYAVAADKGSPGVTTTAVALGAVWPGRALVAECDPAGGDLAYRLPGRGGAPLDPNHGLLSLAATARHGLEPARIWEHVQLLGGGLEVLVGTSTAEQAGGLASLWDPLGQALARLPEADVLADLGRLGPRAPTLPLLRHAAVAVLVARATVDSVAHARDRLAALAGDLRDGGVAGPALGLVLVTEPKESRAAAAQVAEALRAARLPAEVLGTIAHDPKAARLLSGRWHGRLGGSLLVRTARQVAARLHARVAAEHEPAR